MPIDHNFGGAAAGQQTNDKLRSQIQEHFDQEMTLKRRYMTLKISSIPLASRFLHHLWI